MATPLIQLKSAQATYQEKVALRNIHLTVHPGEKLALVGRSGTGKSTLLHLIYAEHPDGVALVPQNDGLVQTLSVFHNVYMGRLGTFSNWYNLINLIKPWEKRITEIDAILHRLHLSEKLFEPVGELSGGQRQRVAIARSLYQGGNILLADEPISAVDEHQARLILDALCGDFKTVILAMHDITLALEYCDRVIGLQDGHIVLDQPSTTLTHDDLAPLYRNTHS